MRQKSVSLKYEPSSEPLHISAKQTSNHQTGCFTPRRRAALGGPRRAGRPGGRGWANSPSSKRCGRQRRNASSRPSRRSVEAGGAATPCATGRTSPRWQGFPDIRNEENLAKTLPVFPISGVEFFPMAILWHVFIRCVGDQSTVARSF